MCKNVPDTNLRIAKIRYPPLIPKILHKVFVIFLRLKDIKKRGFN